MKIERRDYTVFIAHNGLTLFFNRYVDKETKKPFFFIRANKGLHGVEGTEITSWITVGEMRVEPEDLKKLVELLGGLL